MTEQDTGPNDDLGGPDSGRELVGRRQVLAWGATAGLAAGSTELAGELPAAAATSPDRPRAPHNTTLALTILRGAPNAAGFRRHVVGPGEPYLVRTDLGGVARPDRGSRRRAISAFVQLTDMHVQDTQSPSRVEFLDRYSDTNDPQQASPVPFAAAYRPQELLTAQVADGMARAVRGLSAAPMTGTRLTAAVVTGDSTDNCQANELRWMISILDGTRLVPDSGAIGRFEGVADGNVSTYDTAYWHPGGTPAGATAGPDQFRARYGFPTISGLIAAATRAFTPVGLPMPWYAVHGNHDGLLSGNFPPDGVLNALSVGSVKPIGLRRASDPTALHARLGRGDASAVPDLLANRVRFVTPDPARRIVSRTDFVAEHFTTTGAPRGHGFTPANRTAGTAYYVVDLPGALAGTHRARPVRVISLDTVNPNGEADGSIDTAQFAWLQARLADVRDRLTVVVSHHTSDTMNNALVGTGGDLSPRVLGPQVLQTLLTNPQVVLWVNGHTHTNLVTPRPRPGGGGLWEITTASHIDWPHQARTLEIADNGDRTISVFTTIIDSAGAPSWSGALDVGGLVSLSRELAANDPQEQSGHDATTDGRRGRALDRNVELIVPLPAGLRPW